jgi:peroxiredoxin
MSLCQNKGRHLSAAALSRPSRIVTKISIAMSRYFNKTLFLQLFRLEIHILITASQKREDCFGQDGVTAIDEDVQGMTAEAKIRIKRHKRIISLVEQVRLTLL